MVSLHYLCSYEFISPEIGKKKYIQARHLGEMRFLGGHILLNRVTVTTDTLLVLYQIIFTMVTNNRSNLPDHSLVVDQV